MRFQNRAANALLSLGLKQHDCVALCIENSPRLLFLTLGAQRIGLYYTLLSTRLSAADVAYIVKDSGASVAIVSSDCMSAATTSPLDLGEARLVGVDFADSAIESWDVHLLAASDGPPIVLAPGREMLYSSGTTGRPKGVRKPPFAGNFDAVDNRNAAVARSFALDASSVYLSTSPLYHSAPNRFLSAAIHFGATSIVMEKFDAEASLAAIARFACTHSLWVPTMFHRLLPPGETGQIYFESDVQFEYWNDPGKTRAVTSPQGWRSFGDIGHVDREGYLYLTDRRTSSSSRAA